MKTVPIQETGMNTGKQYRYKGSVRIQENNTIFGKQYKYRFQTLHNYQEKGNS